MYVSICMLECKRACLCVCVSRYLSKHQSSRVCTCTICTACLVCMYLSNHTPSTHVYVSLIRYHVCFHPLFKPPYSIYIARSLSSMACISLIFTTQHPVSSFSLTICTLPFFDFTSRLSHSSTSLEHFALSVLHIPLRPATKSQSLYHQYTYSF